MVKGSTERPLRVLELRSVRGTGGGPEKTILLGTARTDRRRYEITVCYLRDARDPVFHIDDRAQGLPIDYVEARERHSFDPGVWRQLTAIIDARRIDLVHAHEYKTDLLALLLARTRGIIPLATAHGWTGHSWRERQVYYPLDRWLLARFPHVIAVSSEIKRAIVGAGGDSERITVVLNGIDPESFVRDRSREALARQQFKLPTEAVVVGSVGRLEPQKDFPLLIRAFASVRQTHPRATLVIAGDGSQRGLLEQLVAALPDPSAVTLLGHVQDVTLLHHTFDIYAQSSIYEGTPNAVLEAMALESPLVATDVGGTAELARDGQEALIVPARDERALTGALLRALADPAATRQRCAAARRRVETELSFDRRLRTVERVYDQLAADRGLVTAATVTR